MQDQQIVLSAEGVTVAAKGADSRPLCAPLSFQLRQGQKALLSGPSGCGKTTLLNALVALHPVHSGRIRLFEDTEVVKLKAKARQNLLRSRIAYVGQDLNPFPGLTVQEFLEFNQRISNNQVDREFARSMLDGVGVGQCWGKELEQLSKGQLQRVLVCGGIVRRSELVILDEPTSALDTHSRDALIELLDEYVADGMTCIVVSHDPALTERFDSQVRMDKAGEPSV
ncbi:Glutamine transport ATP-binding protein GlnQ [Corynebacterium urogenitale]|uniref:Glutamine transport ATP-binding protein GlnQ n=1 Tax=Corynebacterium urogenitale TaxID=2487892 RepID=A0A5J6ZAJ7_9CORY|nr:ATPase, T2SS/T4P/T4SS family [Corynebacterium urogenitale]QFQ02665.1 Glutamine transport ATP-binding protein GlnQ [Corynebacterium urogenitale]